jgi:hypothetical protein
VPDPVVLIEVEPPPVAPTAFLEVASRQPDSACLTWTAWM